MTSLPVLSKILRVKINQYEYLYSYVNAWDKTKHRSYSKTRKTIGRIIGDRVILGKKFLSENPIYKNTVATFKNGSLFFTPVSEQAKENKTASDLKAQEIYQRTTALRAGACYALKELADQTGFSRDLEAVFPTDWKEILSLAMFCVIYPDEAISNFEVEASHSLLPGLPVSSQRLSELFASITYQNRQEFMKLRLANATDSKQRRFWAFDTTSISSYSETLPRISWGKNKEGDKLPQLNLALLLDELTGEPLYYNILDGSVSDMSLVNQLLLDLSNLDVEPFNLVLDRGFLSAANMDSMFQADVGFIAGAKISLNIIQQALEDSYRQFNLCPPEQFDGLNECFSCTKTINWEIHKKGQSPEIHPLHIHLYFDLTKKDTEIRNAMDSVIRWEKLLRENKLPQTAEFRKFFYKDETCPKDAPLHQQWKQDTQKWAQFVQQAGFFSLLSNVESDASRALTIYRDKDVIEKAFNNYKDRCSGRRIRCREQSLEGKVFILYLALSLRMLLKNRWDGACKNGTKLERLPELLAELNSLYVYRLLGNGKDTYFWGAIPKKCREWFDLLKINVPPPIFII